MRINSINATSFGGAEKFLPNQRLKVVGKVDSYVDQMLREGFGEIESLAEAYRVKTVKIAQKGENLLVNSGVKTTIFNMNKMKHGVEFYDKIVGNIRENGEVLSILG